MQFNIDPETSISFGLHTVNESSCPCRLVLSLENDLTVRSKTTEMDVKDFVAGSYATILGQEVSLTGSVISPIIS